MDNSNNLLLSYIPRRSFGPSSSSTKTLDVDFHDVFGGPPRRSSIHDWRSSSGEDDSSTTAVVVVGRDPWSGLSEKPVFGGDDDSRRNCPSDDFFDDIFRGDESSNSTPTRKISRDPFSSSPSSSRVSSPSRSLSFQSESFRGTSLSLPSVLSLPAKLGKEMDSSAFPAHSRNPRKNKETALIGFPSSPGASTSRFSVEVYQGHEGSRNDSRSYRTSSLSKEVSLNSEGSVQASKSDNQESEVQCRDDSSSSEVTYNSSHFHFSIYKWPSINVPVTMPLRVRDIPSSRESSEADNIASGHDGSDLVDVELPVDNHDTVAENKHFQSPKENQDFDLVVNKKPGLMDSPETVGKVVSAKPGPKPRSNFQNLFRRVQDNLLSPSSGKDSKSSSNASGIDVGSLGDILEKPKPVSKKVTKPEEPLYCMLKENKPGSAVGDAENHPTGDTERRIPLSENELSTPEDPLFRLLKDIKSESCASDKVMPISKKQTGKRNITNKATSTSLQDVPAHPEDKPVNNNVKGNVKDFVKIFNQEAPSNSSSNVETQDKKNSSTSIGTGKNQAGKGKNQESFTATKVDQKLIRTVEDLPSRVERSSNQFSKVQPEIKTASQIFNSTFERNNSSASFSDIGIENVGSAAANAEESGEDFDCTVKELSQDQTDHSQAPQISQEFQDSDAKIRKWSNGKDGNIRSLLSTLQYVLWPGSGWKPVPLVDIIEGNSVRRAYQKALLCLHPDKLQQKGAAPHQKYIAEKVFDILQEAWTHFSSLGSV
ncbi:molecular chaperone [Ranunculus cassubicifolius]